MNDPRFLNVFCSACSFAACFVIFDGTYDATILAGDSPEAYNDVTHPLRVAPRETRVTFRQGTVDLPPHSLTIVTVDKL
jgi:alpha-N-arabinofuranosidase